jgi:serine/threonine protein kinase
MRIAPTAPRLVHGPYRIDRVLHRTSRTIVHTGRSPANGLVAIKRLSPECANLLPFQRMFGREAVIGRRLEHPSVVHVLDFGVQEGELLLVTEHIDGPSCRSLLAACSRIGEPFPVRPALYIVREVLEALSYVHDACDPTGRALSIVHGNVSPENILLGAMGEVKLTDFGLAAIGEDRVIADWRNARSGVAREELRYASPEQLEGASMDRRSDLYSVGAVLFELLAGESTVPVPVNDDLASPTEVWNGPLTRLMDRTGTDLPLELRLILATALAPHPQDRFSDAREFSKALTAFAHHTGLAPDRRELVGLLRSRDIWPAQSGVRRAVRPEEMPRDKAPVAIGPNRSNTPRRSGTDD